MRKGVLEFSNAKSPPSSSFLTRIALLSIHADSALYTHGEKSATLELTNISYHSVILFEIKKVDGKLSTGAAFCWLVLIGFDESITCDCQTRKWKIKTFLEQINWAVEWQNVHDLSDNTMLNEREQARHRRQRKATTKKRRFSRWTIDTVFVERTQLSVVSPIGLPPSFVDSHYDGYPQRSQPRKPDVKPATTGSSPAKVQSSSNSNILIIGVAFAALVIYVFYQSISVYNKERMYNDFE